MKGLSPFKNFTYSSVTILRHLLGTPTLLEPLLRSWVYPTLSRAKVVTEVGTITEYHAQEMDAKKFHSLINKNLEPFIIRGFLNNSKATEKWDINFFDKNFGDTQIMLRELNPDMSFDKSHIPGLLKEVTASILDNKINRKYAMNTADIFTDNPELESMLPMKKVKDLFKHSKFFVGSQLFLGGRETGSGLHCAAGYNIFMNVYGRKKWTVINPKFTPWLYPEFRSDAFYALSPVMHKQSFTQIEKSHPLYNRIPKKEGILEAGDALINPSWYWHAVDNLDPQTIGVACRWSPPKPLVELNSTYAIMQSITPHMWKVWKRVLSGRKLKDHFNDF
jgi:hypothetical protein